MIYLLIASLLWGPSFFLVPYVSKTYGIDANTLSLVRMFYSLLLFLPLMRTKGISLKLGSSLVGTGAVQFGVMYISYIAAFTYLEGDEVALCTVFTPLLVSLMCNCTDRKFCPVTFLLVCLAISGAVVIRFAHPDSPQFWKGFGLMQLSNVSFAFGQVSYRAIMQQNRAFTNLQGFGWLYLGGFLVTLVAWFSVDNSMTLKEIVQLEPKALGILLWLGLVPSGIGFFLWNFGGTLTSPGTLAIFNDLKIPLSILVFYLLSLALEIEIASRNWARFGIGASLLLLALVLNERWNRRRSAVEEACEDETNAV